MGEIVIRNAEGRSEFLRKRGVHHRRSRDGACLILSPMTTRREVETICATPEFTTRVIGTDELEFVPGAGADWTKAAKYLVHRTAQGSLEWATPVIKRPGKLSSICTDVEQIAVECPGDTYREAAECGFEIIDEGVRLGLSLDDEYVPREVPAEWLAPVAKGGELVAVKAAYQEVLTPGGEAVVVARPQGEPLNVHEAIDGGLVFKFAARVVEIRADRTGNLTVRRRCATLGGADGRRLVVTNEGVTARRGPWTGTVEALARAKGLGQFTAAAKAAVLKAQGTIADAVVPSFEGTGYQWAT